MTQFIEAFGQILDKHRSMMMGDVQYFSIQCVFMMFQQVLAGFKNKC